MCVCMPMSMCEHISVHMYTCLHGGSGPHVSTYLSRHVYTHVCAHVYTHLRAQSAYMFIRMHMHRYSNIATIYKHQGNHRNALQMFARAVRIQDSLVKVATKTRV